MARLWNALINISLFVLMFFSTALPLAFPNRDELLMSGLFFSYAIIVQFLAIMPIYFLFFRKKEAFRAGQFSSLQFMMFMTLIIITQYIVSNVFFPSERQVSSEKVLNLPVLTILLTQLTYGFLAPIYEEITIRGGLFAGLNIIFKNKLVAAMVTSLIFSLMHTQHLEFKYFLVLFLVSLIFILAKVVSGGLLLPIVLHISMNLFAING
ncbi:type II CAAX endopeptidase family protein [Erwinia sp. S59]|uniref:CPBP family intramembrane glutamic endopeptidase n=1 Tax=Erwinia sp. S59 TaxID=2769340 RepID=UPI00190B8A19|nr:type II CAAX endopeptidase family protein [Erwinia sp. S59]MBK0091091.1 CPBP family intramembrane metalloprotease [Erwinia sp. S59]